MRMAGGGRMRPGGAGAFAAKEGEGRSTGRAGACVLVGAGKGMYGS